MGSFVDGVASAMDMILPSIIVTVICVLRCKALDEAVRPVMLQ